MRAATLVLFACALAVGVLGKMPSEPERAEMMKKCITESGLDESAKKDIFIMPEGEPSQKIKCFHACMSREMGVMVDGNINKDKAIEMIPADFLEREKMLKFCRSAVKRMIPPPPPRPE